MVKVIIIIMVNYIYDIGNGDIGNNDCDGVGDKVDK